MGTAGNDVTFAQPQNYNGTTTIESGAVLRLGSGSSVPLNYVTLNNGVKSTALVGTYSGDASLLTAQSSNGASTDAIVDNGRLIVQNTATAITLSQISGSGSFTQAGAAATTLLNNSYSGGTTISAGSVLAGDAHAFGTGSVVNGAGLGFASGVYAASIGGSYSQSSGATLTVPIAITSQATSAGHLSVTGSVTLAGTLVLNFSGTPTAGQKIVLIDAAGGLSGSFGSIVANGASVTAGQDATTFYVIVQ
jgi:autotransporter-associated beta strand protein